MKLSLLLADIDGTLVDPTGELWPEAFEVADAAESANVVVALCSARPEWSIRALADQLGPVVRYAVSFQGAMISRRVALPGTGSQENWETVKCCVLDSAVAASIARLTRPRDSLWWYTNTSWYVRAVDDASNVEAQIVRSRWTAVGLNEPPDTLLKILIVRPDQPETLVEELTSAVLPIRCSQSQPGYIEVISCVAGSDKGASLLRTLERDGESLPRTVAIGDGRNDLGMFAAAEVAITFADASRDVRAAADIVLCADRRLALHHLSDQLRAGSL